MKGQQKNTKEFRQEVLDYIIERSKLDYWTSMSHLAYAFNISERMVRQVICDIREDDEVQKIIIGCDKGYKVLSKEEEFAYLLSKKCEILKSLKRYYKDIKRFNANDNYTLDFTEEEKLDIMKTIGVWYYGKPKRWLW